MYSYSIQKKLWEISAGKKNNTYMSTKPINFV